MTAGEKAAQTAKRNREARAARAQAEKADREMMIEAMKRVLSDPEASTTETLRAAEILLSYGIGGITYG